MTHTRYTAGLTSLAILTVGCLSLAAQRPSPMALSNSRMSGTYELERTRGGNPERAAETATRSLPPGLRNRAYQSLLARLEPPETLSIDRRGRTVTIASSHGPRSEFDADGRTLNERGPDGRIVATRAEIVGDQLRVSTSSGSRGSDFSVTFQTLDNGAGLLVTRRLDDEDLARPVTFQSYYRRSGIMPRWDVYAPRPDYRDDPGPAYRPAAERLNMRAGTRIFATLETPISMRTSRHGDPVTLTVRSPAEFQGARIDGLISRVNASRNSERGNDLRVDFRSIELDGRTFEFDAFLNTVRLSDGSLLRVHPDGDVDVQDGNNGSDTVRNGAIGATVGAIIGALAGGGKGAAVGAVIGGAGGVIVSQGHEQLDMSRGADVTLTATTR